MGGQARNSTSQSHKRLSSQSKRRFLSTHQENALGSIILPYRIPDLNNSGCLTLKIVGRGMLETAFPGRQPCSPLAFDLALGWVGKSLLKSRIFALEANSDPVEYAWNTKKRQAGMRNVDSFPVCLLLFFKISWNSPQRTKRPPQVKENQQNHKKEMKFSWIHFLF